MRLIAGIAVLIVSSCRVAEAPAVQDKGGPVDAGAVLLQGRPMTTLGEPSAQSLFLGTLHTAQALDRLSPLELVRVQGSCAPELTQEHLESLFKTARPVPAGDKSIDAWQYSPACHVELSSLGRSWKSELFLGGRGILTDDKGRRAVFDFSPAPPAP